MLAAVLALAGLGLLNLVAIGEEGLALHQLISVAVGLLLFGFAQRSRSQSWPMFGRLVYIVALGMLLAVATGGVSANGARRWLVLGSFVLQPSELAKLGLLLVLSDVLGRAAPNWRRVIFALPLAAVPIGLTLLEPDLSTAGLLTVVTLTVLVLARVRFMLLLALLAAAATLAPLALKLARPYQLARLHAFLGGANDPRGAGWSTLQAHIAVASGGHFGIASAPSHQLLAEFLPARQTDLAFASLVEQWGLVAGALALLAVLILIWRLVAAARLVRTSHSAVMAASLAILVGAEAAISVAGNLGALPLAGVPFPLLSFGGSAAVAHLAAFGLVLAGRRDAHRRILWQSPHVVRRGPRLMRSAAVALALMLAALGSLTRHIQEAQGGALRVFAYDEMTRCLTLPAPRGLIEDRHGVVLARNDASTRVFVVPALLERDHLTLAHLAILLVMNPAGLQKLIAGHRELLSLEVAEVPAKTGERVAAAHLTGVLVLPSQRRVYPYGPMLAPILGFTGVATPDEIEALGKLPPGTMVGRAGLERQYDRLLRGRDGYQCLLVNPRGVPVWMSRLIPPLPGGDLRLSLDIGLQQQVTAALQTALRGVPGQPRGDEGAAVVLDARSGEVLAMASLPAYDNNLYGPPIDTAGLRQAMAGPGDPMLSHATQVALPPGSIFKLVVAAADAIHNAIPPSWVIPTGYWFTLGTGTFHGWTWLPPQNLPQAIALSNDVYFYKLAVALGPDRMIQTAQAFGVGQKTGIDLPGESSGFLGTPASVEGLGVHWYPGSTVILGIGQGYITTTPLQVARFTAGVASGTLVTPRLGVAFRNDAGDGLLALPAAPANLLPFAAQLGPVRDGMRMAVTQGTANQLRSLPVSAGGKTGTAEDPSTPNHATDAWFTAVAPMERPEVVATVLVRGGGEGYYTSEPAVAQILKYYFSQRAAIQALAPVYPPPFPLHPLKVMAS